MYMYFAPRKTSGRMRHMPPASAIHTPASLNELWTVVSNAFAVTAPKS